MYILGAWKIHGMFICLMPYIANIEIVRTQVSDNVCDHDPKRIVIRPSEEVAEIESPGIGQELFSSLSDSVPFQLIHQIQPAGTIVNT